MTEVLQTASQFALSSSSESEEEESLLALLVTLVRKSLLACKSHRASPMDIGWPTDVRHVAHVTFDRFNGFLGLPDDFDPDVPRRPPSASATVFGVSTESMQLSYDPRGNSIPTILLMLQSHLYAQGGLQAEGIFRINAENSQEEFVRNQLNGGVIPQGIDVHCLAGLIKVWFRELPNGILDCLEPEQVIQSQTEEECAALVRLLPPTEAALLDWAINLMADVVQHEDLNKMNAHNIAMVFAPNMTQMADPLTALMYAVQVMNFLKTLILMTLKDRKDSIVDPSPARHLEPSDENGHESPSQTCTKDVSPPSSEDNKENMRELVLTAEKPIYSGMSPEADEVLDNDGDDNDNNNGADFDASAVVDISTNSKEFGRVVVGGKNRTTAGQSSSSPNMRKGSTKKGVASSQQQEFGQKAKGISKLSRMESRLELIEAWR